MEDIELEKCRYNSDTKKIEMCCIMKYENKEEIIALDRCIINFCPFCGGVIDTAIDSDPIFKNELERFVNDVDD
jgi:hypothetical protein